MIGTTRFTVSKLLSSALDGAEEGRIACTFTPEGRENASFCSLSENAKKYITECIFKPFSEDNENLFRIDGTCEIFCPMNGTNTGWHRDGFQSGCYIGHALFEGWLDSVPPASESADGSSKASVFREATSSTRTGGRVPHLGVQKSAAKPTPRVLVLANRRESSKLAARTLCPVNSKASSCCRLPQRVFQLTLGVHWVKQEGTSTWSSSRAEISPVIDIHGGQA